MKKKLMAIAIVVIALVASWSFNQNQNGEMLSTLTLGNVEALAQSEINPSCPNGCVNSSGGCYCNGYYSQYGEYRWK